MNAQRLILLGQLKEAINSKEPNMQNRCRGLINTLVSLETENPDTNNLSEESRDKFFKNLDKPIIGGEL